jgi:hypothetical protein
MLDQIEQQRLRPLQIVDHQNDRLRGRQRSEQAPHDEERLFRGRRRTGEQRRGRWRARALAVVARRQRLERRAHVLAARPFLDAQQRAQRLGKRRKGRAACRVAVHGQHGGAIVEPTDQLGDEPRLAEAGRAQHHRTARAPPCDGALVHRRDAAQFRVASDETGSSASRPVGRARRRDEAVTVSERPRNASTPNRSSVTSLAHQMLRRLAEQHIAVAPLRWRRAATLRGSPMPAA